MLKNTKIDKTSKKCPNNFLKRANILLNFIRGLIFCRNVNFSYLLIIKKEHNKTFYNKSGFFIFDHLRRHLPSF